MDYKFTAVLVGLFILLSPGFFLTLPSLSVSDLTHQGVSFGSNPTATTFCSANTKTEPNCKKAMSVWRSGYTTLLAGVVHTVVFGALLYAASRTILPAMSYQSIGIYSGIFFALTPGMIINVPTLGLNSCGSDKKISDDNGANNGYCSDTRASLTNCDRCNRFFMSHFTSDVDVLVHAVVFGAVVYYLSQNLYI